MAYQLKVIAFTSNQVKKITSANSKIVMDASAMFFSGSADDLTLNETFTNSDYMWIILQRGANATIRFTADSSGSNGQGIRVPKFLDEVKITTVSGTVKRLNVIYQTQATTKADAYSDANSSTVSANEVVEYGDLVVCDNTGYFEVKFTAKDDSSVTYIALPIGFMADSNR